MKGITIACRVRPLATTTRSSQIIGIIYYVTMIRLKILGWLIELHTQNPSR